MNIIFENTIIRTILRVVELLLLRLFYIIFFIKHFFHSPVLFNFSLAYRMEAKIKIHPWHFFSNIFKIHASGTCKGETDFQTRCIFSWFLLYSINNYLAYEKGPPSSLRKRRYNSLISNTIFCDWLSGLIICSQSISSVYHFCFGAQK